MVRRCSQLALVALSFAACAVAIGCGGGDSQRPELAVSFQAPAGEPLAQRVRDMRRAAQLELDAIHSHTKTVRLRLVEGPYPQAVAVINALAPFARAGRDQLTINLTPPERRVTDPLRRTAGPARAPEIRLAPPNELARMARRDYVASGAPGAARAITDSPLTAGTPRGLYVTYGLDAHSYPPAGSAFFKKYSEKYGHAPDRFAIYGYEAVGLLIDAIRRVEQAGHGVDQRSVADMALAIRDRYAPVGHYDVLPSRQTTLYVFQARGADAPTGPASLIEALR